MNDVNILSKDHFAAHQQVVSDYKLLLICENELATHSSKGGNPIIMRLKKDIIFLLQRIIINKNILTENTKADQDYLQTLTSTT
ncbi:hypothetical protein QO200_16610 [Flavobacterium sp. Arc3]|jgi:hypothetical protein|uniref:hypothetical protein n=1 Tax=unclassified Flavobacterium TaxID=196869 RepID=UPI00352FCECE